MSTTKQIATEHTPGVWKFQNVNHLGIPSDEAGSIWRTAKLSNGEIGSTLIAQVSNSPGREEADANGHLMAAAPQLLDCVAQLLEAFESQHPTHPAIEQAKAILKTLQTEK